MQREPKYKAIVHFIEDRIIDGTYHIGDRIPSVNAFRIRFALSRSSVLLAMEELKSRGIIEAEAAVGYFVASCQVRVKEKVLLLFNEFNAFKETIYKAFMEEIGEDATVDLMFHNYNRTVFETLLRNASGKYTSYVLMPGKFRNIESVLESTGGHIVLADHFDKSLKGRYSSVGQDFELDTYNALASGIEHLSKYRRITLIQKSEIEPDERYAGLQRFCLENGFLPRLTATMDGEDLARGDLYITAEDSELVKLLKAADRKGLVLGTDIGIISYNDTPVKEILAGGISVLSSNFSEMGRTLACLVRNRDIATVANPCSLIIRRSV